MKHQRKNEKPSSAKTTPGAKGVGSKKNTPTRSQKPEREQTSSKDTTTKPSAESRSMEVQTQEVPAIPVVTECVPVRDADNESVSEQATVDKNGFTTRLKKQQRSYLYCSALSAPCVEEIKTVFPNIKSWKNPNAEENSHQHPLLATLRANFETFIRYEIDCCLPPGDKVVQDIGGNPRRNMAKAALFDHGYHSCNPILDAADERRQQERLSKYNLGAYYCNHKFSECECVEAAGYISVDSAYYLSDDELYKAASKPFWACFHDLRGETGSVPGTRVNEGSFVRIGHTVEMAVKGNGQPYHHHDMDWAFEGRRVKDKWLIFEEKLRYGTYVAGKFYLSRFEPTKPALTLHVNPTPLIQTMAPRLLGLTPEDKLAKARRIVMAEKVSSSEAARSIKDLVTTAEAIDRKVKISRMNRFELWRLSVAAWFNDLYEMVAIYSYFSYKTFFLRWISLILILLVVYYLEINFEDWARGRYGSVYATPEGWDFYYWLMPQTTQNIHHHLCMHGVYLDSWRSWLKDLILAWDYLEILPVPEPIYVSVYCQRTIPEWTYYLKYLYWIPLGLISLVLTSMEACSLVPIAYRTTTRVVFFPCDMALKVGKFVVKEATSFKHGRNIDQVIGSIEYQAPIPSASSDTQMTALKDRLAQGVESVTTAEGNPWNAVKFNVWDELDVKNMSFETWIKEFYGRRDEPAMVAKYRQAYSTQHEMRRSPCLYVDAFVKMECYPGKLDKIKPRVVQNVSDLRQIIRTSVMCSAITYEVKEYQTQDVRSVVYSSGMCPRQMGAWVEHWRERGFDCVLENDFSEFESRVSVEALEFEFKVYEKLVGKYPGWAQTSGELKRQFKPVINLNGGQYTRFGGRCSGVPNTSLGNTILNMASTMWVMSSMGLSEGVDFVGMFLGDDSYVMVKQELDVELVAELYARLGFKAEVKFYYPNEIHRAEYCSGRFLPHSQGLCWAPKAGRILLKGISVPSDVQNVAQYIAPVMRHYATKVYCPIIQFWAQSYCRINGITWTEEPVQPAALDVMHDIYGQFELNWMGSVSVGCWYYPLQAISPFVDMDCPISENDAPNHYGVPDRKRYSSYMTRFYHFVMKFYVPTNKTMPHDEVLGYQIDHVDF